VVCLKNPLQPANRLPPEIIALCAAFVPRTNPKPIVTLTHVCRYWREAIISSPENWTLIGSGWKRLVPLCLERAGTVPITVRITISDIRGDETFLQVLLPHVSRISDMFINGFSFIENLEADLPGFFASTMPNLTSLGLEQTVQPSKLFPSDKTSPPSLFYSFSKLESLHLTRVPLYPILSRVPSLVELKLFDYTIHFGKFIGFLESNLALEIVDLGLGFVKGSVSTTPKGTVSLPRLRHLGLICDNAIDARGLLSCLSLPRGVDVEVQGSQQNSCASLPSFLPCPPTHIQDLLTPITTVKKSRYSLRLSGSGGSFYFNPFEAPPPNAYEEFNPFATDTVREFHLLEAKVLGNHLSRALERLPALEALGISEATLRSGSLSALIKEPLLCPSLKTIAFFGCEVTSEMIRELKGVLKKREHLTTARLYRVIIVIDISTWPDRDSIWQLITSVPHLDIRLGRMLPDLL